MGTTLYNTQRVKKLGTKSVRFFLQEKKNKQQTTQPHTPHGLSDCSAGSQGRKIYIQIWLWITGGGFSAEVTESILDNPKDFQLFFFSCWKRPSFLSEFSHTLEKMQITTLKLMSKFDTFHTMNSN